MNFLNENTETKTLSKSDLDEFVQWLKTSKHKNKENVKNFIKQSAKVEDDGAVDVEFLRHFQLVKIYNDEFLTDKLGNKNRLNDPGGGTPIKRVFTEEEKEQLFQEERARRLATMQEVSEILKEVRKPAPSGGGSRLELVTKKCDSPIISGVAGAFSGFVPRYLYHNRAGFTVTKQQQKILKDYAVSEFPLNRRQAALQKSKKFNSWILDVMKNNPGWTLGLSAAALSTAGFLMFRDPGLVNKTADVATDIATKPFKEGAKFFELIDVFVNWGNKIDNAFSSVGEGKFTHYVLDPCFAAAMFMGFTSLSVVNVATGRASIAKRYEDFFRSIESKNIARKRARSTLQTTTGGGRSVQFLREFDDIPGAQKYVDDVLKLENEVASEIAETFGSMAQKLDLDPNGSNFEVVKQAFVNRVSSAENMANTDLEDAFYTLIGDKINGFDSRVIFEGDFAAAHEIILGTTTKSQEISNAFMKTMRTNVLNQLAGETTFFKVFDIVPGVIPDANSVKYLKDVVSNYKKEFASNLKILKTRREVVDSLIKDKDPGFFEKLRELENHLDEITLKTDLASSSRSAFDAILDTDVRTFYDSLPTELQTALGNLYNKKRDLLNQIDEYEALSKNSLSMAGGRKDFSRFIADENDYVKRAFEEAAKVKVLRQGLGDFIPDIIKSRIARISLDAAGAALFAVTGLSTVLDEYVLNLEPKNLKRETVEEIHQFLDSPLSDNEKKAKIMATQRAIAGFYDSMSEITERRKDLSYAQVQKLGMRKAIKMGVQVDLSGFGENLKPVEKMIMAILVLEYLKKPLKSDPMSPEFAKYKDVKLTDRVDNKRFREAAVHFRRAKLPLFTDPEFDNLFEGSYYIIRSKFKKYGELKVESDAEKASTTPTDSSNQEESKTTDQSSSPASPPGKRNYTLREVYNITKKAAPSWATKEDIVKLAAITIGESGLNARAKADASTGLPKDNSYGLWQINMLGELGPARRKKYKLKSNEDLYNPNIAAKVAWDIYTQAKGGPKGKKNGMQPWAASTKSSYQEHIKRTRAVSGRGIPRLKPRPIKEYKLNDLRNLVTEVMNEERVPQQRSIGNTDIDKLNRRLKNDPHAMVDIAYGGNIPDRDLEDNVAHHEHSVVKAKDSEFYMAAKAREERDPDGKKDYYRQIIDAAGDDAYIVVHEKLYGSDITTTQPAIFNRSTAESFYDFLEYWPEDKYGKIRLNDKTATYDAVKGGSDRSSTSTHKHGSAVDLNVPFKKGTKEHLNFKDEALTIAMGVGFNSFGFGPNVLHMDTRRDKVWWVYGYKGSEKFKFGGKGLQSIVPIQSYAFRKLVYGPSIPDDRITPLDRAVAQLTGKRRIREMKKNDLDKLIAEFLNENTGQGYGQYPYHSDSHDEDEPAEDYMEEWKALELDLVRDETRNTAIAVAKILVKDLELFNDVLDLAGQNQSLGTEILRKLKETKVNS